MPTNEGSISYDIDGNTLGLIKSGKDVKSFNQNLQSQFEKSTKSINKFDSSANSAASSTKKMSMGMKNLGYQLTDLGTQFAPIVGANGAMLAIIQQGGQIIQALNPLAAAVFTVGGALAGALLPSLFDSNNAAEDLEETLTTLSQVIKQNEQGVNVLSNEFANLAKKSSEIAKAQLALSITQATEAINLSGKAAKDAVDEFDTLFNAVEKAATPRGIQDLDDALERTNKSVTDLIENTDLYGTGLTQLKSAVENLNDEFGTTTEESVKFIRSFEEFNRSRSPTALKALAETVTSINLETKKATPELQRLSVKLNSLSVESLRAEEIVSLLKDAMGDLDGALKTGTENQVLLQGEVKRLNESLKRQVDVIGMSRSGVLEYNKALALQDAELSGVDQATKESIKTSFDKLIANEKEIESEKAKAKAKRESEKAQREADQAARESVQALSALGQISPSIQIGVEQTTERQNLTAAYDQGLISEQEYLAQKLSLNQSYEEQLRSLQEERFRRESEANAFLLDTFDALGNTAANSMAGILEGTMTATEAMQALAKTVLNEAVKALVQMGIEQVKNQIIGQSASAAAVATGVATGSALAAAYAPAAALASLATSGSNAAPAQAGITSTFAVAKGLSFGGGRESGGPVGADSFYRFGEENKPEVIQTSAGAFAFPGDKGRVFNGQQLDQIGGGGGGGNQMIVHQNITINGNGDSALKDAVRQGAEQGAKRAQQQFAESLGDKRGVYYKSISQGYGSGKTTGRIS